MYSTSTVFFARARRYKITQGRKKGFRRSLLEPILVAAMMMMMMMCPGGPARNHSTTATYCDPHSPADTLVAAFSCGAPHTPMCTCSSCLRRSLRRTRDVRLLQHNSLLLRSPYLDKQLHRLEQQWWGGEEEEEQYEAPRTPQQQPASARKHGQSRSMTAAAYATYRHRDVPGEVQQYKPSRSKLVHSTWEDTLLEASEEANTDRSPLHLSPSSARRPPAPPVAYRSPPQKSPTRTYSSDNRGDEHLYSNPATGIDDQADHIQTPSPSHRRPQRPGGDALSRGLGSGDAGRVRAQATALSPPTSTLQLHMQLRQSQLIATTLRQQADEVAAQLEMAARVHALRNEPELGRGRPTNKYLFDNYTHSMYNR